MAAVPNDPGVARVRANARALFNDPAAGAAAPAAPVPAPGPPPMPFLEAEAELPMAVAGVANANVLNQESVPVMFNLRSRRFTIKVGTQCARGETLEELRANVDTAIESMKAALAQQRIATTRKAEKATAIKTASAMSSSLTKLRGELTALQAKRDYVALKEGAKKPGLLSLADRKHSLNTTKTYATHLAEATAAIAAKQAEIAAAEGGQPAAQAAAQAARVARAAAKMTAAASAASVPKAKGLAGMLGFKARGGRRSRRSSRRGSRRSSRRGSRRSSRRGSRRGSRRSSRSRRNNTLY